MIYLLILLIVLVVFFGIWILLVLNDGFKRISNIIANHSKKNDILVAKCDEIVGKYKIMVKNIEADK